MVEEIEQLRAALLETKTQVKSLAARNTNKTKADARTFRVPRSMVPVQWDLIHRTLQDEGRNLHGSRTAKAQDNMSTRQARYERQSGCRVCKHATAQLANETGASMAKPNHTQANGNTT